MADPAVSWIDALIARHTRRFSPPEYLKAVRALSARYVERRAQLPRRSAVDSPGKRAAFASYYAPLHFLAARAVVDAIGAARQPVDRLVDLGCGSGVASAAWAMTAQPGPEIVGVDRDAWALTEAVWNWQHLGVAGRTRRADLVRAAEDLVRERRALDRTALVLAWSVNELDAAARRRLLTSLGRAAAAGASVLVLEPLARTAVPWWNEWAAACLDWGGRTDEWRFDMGLPLALDRVREAAGFRRQPLGVRSLWRPGRRDPRATIG
ncbi:MAG: methyltransferase domain-containing protein [Acidobacteria bacterium]|nr:methyltransferase domain-containing protein [Acidobacteriota bacterium]